MKKKPRSTLALLVVVLMSTTEMDAAAGPSDATSVPDLLFRDFYTMPVGPRGLEASQKLVGLDGQTVRMRGYMVHEDAPMPGVFILSPLPVELGDADESLSDDLPPAVVFVHFDAGSMPYTSGVVQVSGQLSIGAQEEADGHVSQVRLHLERAQLAAVTKLESTTTGNANPTTGPSS